MWAIARHVGRDRKTVRAHLSGEHVPGRRRPAESDPFDTFGAYVGQRLADDPHLWATALFDEVTGLGYGQSYPTFVRKIRNLRLRPSCGACAGTRGRPTVVIDHPPGEECQWDWVEVGGHTVGVDSVRAGGCPVPFGEVPSVDQQPPGPGSSGGGHRRGAATLRGHRPAVADAFAWRRWPCERIQPSFVGVAKHYGVGIDACPPRRPNRKGVVEKAIHYLSQRWWRTADINGLAEAQDSLDAFCEAVGDARRRAEGTVGELADTEPLLPLPAMPYPAEGTLVRKVAANGLVSLWGNRYSVPPSVVGTQVRVRWRLGDPTIDVVSASGRLVAAHRKCSPRPRTGGSPSPAHRSPPQGRAGGVHDRSAPQTETEPASVSCSAGDRG